VCLCVFLCVVCWSSSQREGGKERGGVRERVCDYMCIYV